ncbi:MAG TPA: hypothetical protein VF158_11780 [Longimicrobiales bacterium]
MTDAGRFERGERYAAAHGVVTTRGVDTITGLDVLIYDFPGAPTLETGAEVSQHALKVLFAGVVDGQGGPRGQLVAAYPTGASLVAQGESAVDDGFVLGALQALKDAHGQGVAHGDITASRLLYGLGEVYVEGFGVPWRVSAGVDDARALMRADVVALAKALLALAGDDLSAEVAAALRSVEPANPPLTAERLHAIVKRLAGGAVKVPALGFTELTLPTVPAPSQAAPAPREQAPREQAPRESQPRAASAVAPQPQAPPAGDPLEAPPDDPEPITLHSDPGLGPPPRTSPKDSSPGFVKAPPPGAKYRHGTLEDGPPPAPIRLDREERQLLRPRRSWRGPALLLLMILAAGLAGYLAWRERPNRPAAAASPFTSYFVDVEVEPSTMPPVDLIVLRSPPDSRYEEGDRLSTVPKSVAFDAAGTWVVYAKFLTRQTPPVTVRVPEDRAVRVVFPPQEE